MILVSDLQQPNLLDEASVSDFGTNIYYHDNLFITIGYDALRHL